ncbi:Planctomycete cytochrome C [Novipirellula galeiformis]|uniref:Planctomycete cytochrome C n=2 Tax=Novipirellula galeiformis TaxID=2528004 RepID=A0A5C6CMQ9_9BACT|nr:Planctomycete cytochrome C [Novipirellula galeiformis]
MTATIDRLMGCLMIGRRPRPAQRLCAAFLLMILSFTFSSYLLAVDFTNDIEPILQEHCLDCHGEDEPSGQLRLDRLANMLRGGNSGEAAVVPGDPAASFLVKLIKHQESGLEMPPDDSLSAEQIKHIERWIADGAKTPEHYGPATETTELTHWSFRRVTRPVTADNIDGFIRHKLSTIGLSPSPQADRRVLIRRLYLVMLGLPPTPEQVDAFVNDPEEHAWGNLVDRVLASQHYGERWASHWLDLVRFAETHGFEMNRERPTAWRYRDWVIGSLNDDKPYDQFVREQIAGDAMGSAIGTAFLVAGPVDQVKSPDAKLLQMQRMNELDDMINTCGTAFLGLTTGCARCHNHKFDPITQKDYYAMQAVFAGVQHGDGVIPLSEQSKQKLAEIEHEIQGLEDSLAKFVRGRNSSLFAIDDAEAEPRVTPSGVAADLGGVSPNLGGGRYTWWKNEFKKEVVHYQPNQRGRYRIWLSWGAGFKSHTTDARYILQSGTGRTEIAKIDQQRLADGSGQPTGVKLWSGLYDAGVHWIEPNDRIVLEGGENGSAITSDVIVFQAVSEDSGTASHAPRESVKATHNIERFPARQAKYVRFWIDATNGSEPCIDELEIFSGELNVALASSGAIATSSGDFKHPIHKLTQINDGQYGNQRSWIAAAESGGWVQIELPAVTTIDRIEWARDREGQYQDRLAIEYRIECASDPGHWELLASSADRLTPSKSTNQSPYVFTGFPESDVQQGQAWLERLEQIQAERAELQSTTKAWIGRFKQPGPTYRLYRGEPDAKRDRVGPDGIAVFASLDLPLDTPEQQRREAFADWVTSKENPLTARVIVNRLWQFHFGVGIVDTPSDFGLNGTAPTHPELLDWLAVELMESEWSLKHLHRLILNSHTWQQSSRPTPQGLNVDANARLLWRFPTRRLEAEGIRDSMLAASGSLDLAKLGGPGFSGFEVELENVRHYHPKSVYGPEDWRRMIYMTKVRQEREPVFGAFDCPDASMVTPKRSRSTTPLQALNLLNSPFVMQQTGILATRLQQEADSIPAQITRAWQLCFQRRPSQQEIRDSTRFIEQHGLDQFTRVILNSNEFVFIP